MYLNPFSDIVLIYWHHGGCQDLLTSFYTASRRLSRVADIRIYRSLKKILLFMNIQYCKISQNKPKWLYFKGTNTLHIVPQNSNKTKWWRFKRFWLLCNSVGFAVVKCLLVLVRVCYVLYSEIIWAFHVLLWIVCDLQLVMILFIIFWKKIF